MNKLTETIKRLRKFNKWRRGSITQTLDELNISPKQIGEDIDFICDTKIMKPTKLKIDRKKLHELYMKEVSDICDRCEWVSTVTPEMCVGIVSDVLEKHPELIK